MTVNQRVADRIIGLLLVLVVIAGSYSTWQSYNRTRTVNQMMGGMMGGSVQGTNGISPLWHAIGTIVAVVLIGGVYVAIRDELTTTPRPNEALRESPSNAVEVREHDPGSTDGYINNTHKSDEPAILHQPDIMDVLPDDERRIIEPILSSPGITQIELRDRSGYSKSKVSQTVSALEKRGLLFRERQGRTYRVYPNNLLTN